MHSMEVTSLTQNEFAHSDGLRRAIAGGYQPIWATGYVGLSHDSMSQPEFRSTPRIEDNSTMHNNWKNNDSHQFNQLPSLTLPSQGPAVKIESPEPRQGQPFFSMSSPQEVSSVQHEWASTFQHPQMHRQFAPGFSSPIGTTHPPIKIEDDSDSMSTMSSAYPTVEDFLPSSFSSGDNPPHHLPRRRSIPSVLQYHPRHNAGPISQTLNKGRRDRRVRVSVPDHLDCSETFFHRSNYENIMDGSATDIYPDEFAAKILSKKIAHKISEKTRRTRLTTAIREIEKLLPPPQETGNDDGSKSGDHGHDALSNPVSKVDVVESAVGFIKKLKQDTEEAIKRADEAERRAEQAEGHNEELDRRIEETERRAVEAEQLLKVLRDGRQVAADDQW